MSRVHKAGPSIDSLVGVDLNLLVAFDALARELSVTRAAQRVGVTQSAMSHTLRRLRDLFGDPLLIRGRGGMVLTPRGEGLVLPVRSGLLGLSRALAEPPAFDPATSRRAFRIASPDLFNLLAMPRLLERVRREAPGVDFALVSPPDARLPELLETGELDVALAPWMDGPGGERTRTAPGLLRRTLFRDRFLTLLRADHPAARGELSLEAFTALSHVLVSPDGRGEGIVDLALRPLGRSRRLALRVPDFHSALSIVARSDLALTGPSALTALDTVGQTLRARETPLELPNHSLNLLWHERFTADPGHAWLRSVVGETAARVAAAAGVGPDVVRSRTM